MARQDYTLFDSFQDKGYWWLPETPDKPVPGLLFHSEEETRLEVFGDLYEESLQEKGIVKQPRPVPIILGWMEDQGICTLYKNHRTSQKLHVPGSAGSAVWESQALFLGKHFPKPDEIVFCSMGVNYPNLEEWVGESPFKMPAHEMEGDKLVEYESVYVARDAIEVEVPTLEATLKIECAPRFIHGFQSRTQEYAEFVSLYPKTQQHLDWYLASYQDFASLLTLFIGHPMYAKRIVAYSMEKTDTGEAEEKEVSVYLHHKNRHESKSKHPLEMLVALPWIRGWFAEAIKKWFEKASTLRDVYNLFFSSLYAPAAFLQSDFLNLIQAVESFSRTRGGDLHVADDTYKEIADKLLAAIPEGIDQGLRESLEGHIRFGNQHSLRRRVDAILGSLDKETMKLFCPDPAKFRKEIVDTRNYLAHWDVKSKKKALHGKALWVANQRLRLLLTILLLKEICFKEEAIRGRLMQHPDWMQLIHLYLSRNES